MKTLAFLACLLSSFALSAGAEQGRPQRSRNGGQPQELRGADAPAADEAEWPRIEAWMRQFCPNRLKFLNNMIDPGRQENVKRLVAQRYHFIQRQSYKPLQEALNQQTMAQDAVFLDGVRLRQAVRHGSASLETVAQNQLRNDLHKLFKANIAVRMATVQQDAIKNEEAMVNKWFDNTVHRIRGDAPGSSTRSLAAPKDTEREDQ